MRPIVVLGAGSWGTALAIQFSRGGEPTVLWGRAEDNPEELARVRENLRYLPGAKFPPSLSIEPDLAKALASGDDIVLVVPSSALRAVLTEIKPSLGPRARVAWASKGFELDTGKLPHQVALEVLGPKVPLAVLSGPTFAREVGQGLPTAIAVASPDEEFARDLAVRISSGGFRAYTQIGHRRRRDRRRGQERARDRDRLLRRPRASAPTAACSSSRAASPSSCGSASRSAQSARR